MLKSLKIWFGAISTTAKVAVVTAAIFTGGVANAAVHNTTATKNVEPTAAVQTVTPKTVKCTGTSSMSTETQTVPFTKTTVDDPNATSGKTYVQTAGSDGVKTIVYETTTYGPSGCKPDTKVQKSEEITTQPVAEVTAIGTYVTPQISCSNGSYTNVDGIKVCNPSSSPAGATARCVDGSYSYSLNHSGTCSHHGGVAVWY